jgi:signal peptidase I
MKKKKTLKQEVLGTIGAIFLAVFLRLFVFDNFYVPTGSMIPTVLIWDHLFASKWSYGYSNHSFPYSPNLFEGRLFYTSPKRGDVVTFKVPNDDKEYIKRVVGLPGDKIQMIEGVLHINGESVKLERIEDYDRLDDSGNSLKDAQGNRRLAPQYIETFPDGFSHKIIKTKNDTSTTREYVVPLRHFFMLGDNRDESGDSRFQNQIGYVPEEYIRAKAQIIWFSTDGTAAWWQFWKWLPAMRFSRLFKFIS